MSEDNKHTLVFWGLLPVVLVLTVAVISSLESARLNRVLAGRGEWMEAECREREANRETLVALLSAEIETCLTSGRLMAARELQAERERILTSPPIKRAE